MSQTTGDQPPVNVIATLDFQQYLTYVHQFQENIITIGLLGGLYGVLTILSITSAFALTRRYRKTRLTAVALSITILALYASTTIYVVTSILEYQSYFLETFLYSYGAVWNSSPALSIAFLDIPGQSNLNLDAPSPVKQCTSAATLTVNVILGDAIVCWRACVIWHHSRVVRAVCGFFLLATLGLGAINTTQSCQSSYDLSTSGPGPAILPGTLFEGLPLGVAACVLSLSTNIFTTLLVAYRAWESGRRFKEYLVAKVGGSRVEKLLALLIESGAIYSAIWAVVVAYQVGEFRYEFTYVYPVTPIGPQPAVGRPSATESRFLDIFGVMMTGALVPVIAIYPAIIIVLVALDSSHMERGLTVQHLESLPTPHLALTIDTVAASLRESRLNRTSEVPAEQLRGLRGGDGSDPDESETQDASRRTSVERMQKAKEVICSPTARNV